MAFFSSLDDARVPVSLLTGFLGSGKTTLLNRLLQHPEMARTAVVVNEFGDIPLDHHFIDAARGEVLVLANGCLCCSMQGEFEGLIGRLFARRGRGELPAFERLLVETTGLADPAPIMQVLLNQPLVVDNFRLDAVITTVDALHAMRHFREHAQAVKQVLLADRLVITKTDIVAASDVGRLEEALHRLNPSALRVRPVHGAIEPAALLGVEHAVSALGLRHEMRLEQGAGERPRHEMHTVHSATAGGGQAHSDEAAHLEGISTFSLASEGPLAWPAFSRWLTGLKIRHFDALLRVKGILQIAGEPDPIAIHGVHHVFHPPMRLAGHSLRQAGCRLVFITKGLRREDIAAGWEAMASERR